jgi:hypothetical protein
MAGTFGHIEGYGRSPSVRKRDGGRSMEDIARECERQPGYCEHVDNPKPPHMLFGCEPSAAVQLARERASLACDAVGRPLRRDALCFLGGVASYPLPWTAISSGREQKHLETWRVLLVAFLQRHYGTTLKYALMHQDESHPHVHWGAVPELEGHQLRIETVHPGRQAAAAARAEGGDNRAASKAYKKAMKDWLDDMHIAAFAPIGIARYGPRRQRLTLVELKQRRDAEQALARTLAMSKEIKALWRTQIGQELEEKYALALDRIETDCRQQLNRAERAEGEVQELRARLADIERDIAPFGAVRDIQR